jgi:uncharacterized protein
LNTQASVLSRPADGLRGRIWLALLLALTTLLVALPAFAAPTFPKLTGRVVDDANILSPATEQALTQKLEALETSTGRQLVVATLPSLQGYEIEDYGYQLGRAWGIGSEKTDDGALLIVAPNEKKVRIEVGYGLEPVLTDALSSVIIQSAILPKFRDGDMQAGIVAGTDALVQQLSLPDDQAKAQVAQAAAQPAKRDGGSQFPFVILLVVFWVVFGLLFGGRRGRRRGGFLPGVILGSILGSGRGGGDWGGGGGGWGGGGFSGGGGSFGGGGSSGSW